MYQNEGITKMAYPEESKVSVEVEQPMLAKVLDQLRKEVQCTNELSKEASNYCNSLHLMSYPKGEKMPEKDSEPGIVGLLFTEINKLNEANSVLYDCVNHLRRVVGN
jgi:hypothetical protein